MCDGAIAIQNGQAKYDPSAAPINKFFWNLLRQVHSFQPMTNPPLTSLDRYKIRVSQRAKHVSIRVSYLGEVEVVVPQQFDQRQLPAILEKRQDWIAKTIQRVEAERQFCHTTPKESLTLPEQITLSALTEEWAVKYLQTSSPQIKVNAKEGKLTLIGPVSNSNLCYQTLRRWLMRKAQFHLIPWLRQVSHDIDLPCGNIAIRGQKTLWASCSNRKSISLNYKLLFLPPPLVHYIFVHELSHTIHLNHSPQFWALVEDKEPDYKELDKEVGKGWRYVPAWVEYSPSS